MSRIYISSLINIFSHIIFFKAFHRNIPEADLTLFALLNPLYIDYIIVFLIYKLYLQRLKRCYGLMPLIYCFRNHSFPFHITWIHITDTKVYSECTFIQEVPVPESVSVQLLSSGHFSIPATHPLFWHPVLLPFSLPADMIHSNSGFLLFPEQCSLSHFPDPCSHCISCICISHFFSVSGTQTEIQHVL